MKKIERLKREIGTLDTTRRVYEDLGYSGRPRSRIGVGGFGSGEILRESRSLDLPYIGEPGEVKYRSKGYGPFLKRYSEARSPEERYEVISKEVRSMQQNRWTAENAFRQLMRVLEHESERVEE